MAGAAGMNPPSPAVAAASIHEEGAPEQKKQRGFDYSMWEDDFFAGLSFESMNLEFQSDTEAAKPTLARQSADLREKLQVSMGEWGNGLQPVQKGALAIVALYLELKLTWDSKSDMLLARIVELLCHKELRAHPDAVVSYDNGSWFSKKALPQHLAIFIEDVLGYARFLFLDLQTSGIERSWAAAFAHFAAYSTEAWNDFCTYTLHIHVFTRFKEARTAYAGLAVK